MFEIKGKYGTALCYATVIEESAIEQIKTMCDYILVVLYDGSFVHGFTVHKPRVKIQPVDGFKAQFRQCFCFYP